MAINKDTTLFILNKYGPGSSDELREKSGLTNTDSFATNCGNLVREDLATRLPNPSGRKNSWIYKINENGKKYARTKKHKMNIRDIEDINNDSRYNHRTGRVNKPQPKFSAATMEKAQILQQFLADSEESQKLAIAWIKSIKTALDFLYNNQILVKIDYNGFGVESIDFLSPDEFDSLTEEDGVIEDES